MYDEEEIVVLGAGESHSSRCNCTCSRILRSFHTRQVAMQKRRRSTCCRT